MPLTHDRFTRLHKAIFSFRQHDGELFWAVWDRWNNLLRNFPMHGITKRIQIETFYFGMEEETKRLLNASAKGSFLEKDDEECIKILENMAMDSYQWESNRSPSNQMDNTYGDHQGEEEPVISLMTKLETLSKFVQELMEKNERKEEMPYVSSQPWQQDYPQQPFGFQQDSLGYFSEPQGNQFQQEYVESSSGIPIYGTSQQLSPIENMFVEFMKKNEEQMERSNALIQSQTAVLQKIENQLGLIVTMLLSKDGKEAKASRIENQERGK